MESTADIMDLGCVNYALKFWELEGYSEVWNFILDVQRHMNLNGMYSPVS